LTEARFRIDEARVHTLLKYSSCVLLLIVPYLTYWATYSGTQQGQMGPFPPTGREISSDFAGYFRLSDGKIAEIWVIWDNLTILTQLGHMPAAPGAKMFEAYPGSVSPE
jgi:hypothetical protein